MKRLITMLMATTVALMGMLLVVSPAHAHHTTVSGKVACHANGDYLITWTVENWSGGGPATVTGSNRGVVPAGTQIADGAARQFTEVVATAADVRLEVTATWRDGQHRTSNARTVHKSEFPTDCAPTEQPVTPTVPSAAAPTCETDGRLVVPADTAKVRYEQTPRGSGPGTYTVTAIAEPGYRIVGEATWTITVKPRKTGGDCDVAVTPVAPAVTTITACGTHGSIVLPTTPGVRYALTEGDGKQGHYQVTATAMPGYRIADGATTDFAGDLGDYRDCVEVTPLAPVVSPITACGTHGSVTLLGVEGIDYTVVEGDLREGRYRIEATAVDGHVIAPGAVTVWEGDLGAFVECVEVTPVAPVAIVLTECGEYGALQIPETPGVVYDLVEGDGQQGPWRVVASAEPGHVLAADAETEFSGDLGAFVECVEVSPAEPEVPATPECGDLGSTGTCEVEDKIQEGGSSATSGPKDAPQDGARAGRATTAGVLPNTGASLGLGLPTALAGLLILGGALLTRRGRLTQG